MWQGFLQREIVSKNGTLREPLRFLAGFVILPARRICGRHASQNSKITHYQELVLLTRFSGSNPAGLWPVDWNQQVKTKTPMMRESGSNRRLNAHSLLLLAALGAALLAAGCSQSGPVGVYTCSRARGMSTEEAEGVDAGVTFILEIRSNGSYVSEVENAIRRSYKRAEGDPATGRGTWQIRDGNVVLTSAGREIARLLVEGPDLIDANGLRYTRIGWLGDS
jgi:hypothetical protein